MGLKAKLRLRRHNYRRRRIYLPCDEMFLFNFWCLLLILFCLNFTDFKFLLFILFFIYSLHSLKQCDINHLTGRLFYFLFFNFFLSFLLFHVISRHYATILFFTNLSFSCLLRYCYFCSGCFFSVIRRLFFTYLSDFFNILRPTTCDSKIAFWLLL